MNQKTSPEIGVRDAHHGVNRWTHLTHLRSSKFAAVEFQRNPVPGTLNPIQSISETLVVGNYGVLTCLNYILYLIYIFFPEAGWRSSSTTIQVLWKALVCLWVGGLPHLQPAGEDQSDAALLGSGARFGPSALETGEGRIGPVYPLVKTDPLRHGTSFKSHLRQIMERQMGTSHPFSIAISEITGGHTYVYIYLFIYLLCITHTHIYI